MHPFSKVQQAMLEEEKWTTPSMTYFRPHFMVPPLGETTARSYDPPMTNNWLNTNYDQALDLGQNQQNAKQPQPQPQPQPQAHRTIKHEQVDQTRYGFDQVNYTDSQPGQVKKVEEKKYNCDQCSYVATQKFSLSRHKMTQHEGIKQQPVKTGKTYDCDLCPYQATQITSLKRHTLAKHSGVQYPCDKCEYVGTTPNNLKLHKGSKHDGIRYPCDICGYQATQTGVLNKHKELKHGHQRGTHHNSNMHHTRYTGDPQGQRAIRGPRQQKQPLSGFYHFSSVGRAKVKEANPDLNDLDVSKELSRRWHALDDVTKAMFEDMSDSPRMVRAGGGGGGGGGGGRGGYQMVQYRGGNFRQKRAKKHPDAPKRCLSAFMFFSNGERAGVLAENPELNRVGDMAKELARRWAAAEPDVRQKYQEMAVVDKERYEKAKHEWHTRERDTEIEYPVVAHNPNYSPGQPQQHRPLPALTGPPLTSDGHYAQAHEITSPNRMIGPPNLAF